MHWIALKPSIDDELEAWSWRALQFTPRVARLEEALLLEVSACERLWGGRQRLLHRLLKENQVLCTTAWAQGTTSLIALALLRLKQRQQPLPAALPDGLPLAVLSAAAGHLATLERVGCRSWSELRALPRAGVARRFGAALLEALDAAYGERPESYPWLTLPEVFDVKLELQTLATGAPELIGAASHLLCRLQAWLQARQRGVLALELEWTLDLKRLDGVLLPRSECLVVRTAQPAQAMEHLRRLVGEHLSHATLSAPASYLQLRSLETAPFAASSHTFLTQDNARGEPLHQLVEKLSARLGEHNVTRCQPLQDHRPERMQAWLPARQAGPAASIERDLAANSGATDALYPPWLLARPQRLKVQDHVPQYGGPLRRLARIYRVETAWWEGAARVRRDYFIARSPQAGLVWIFRELAPAELPEPEASAAGQPEMASLWYLQGLYA